MQKDNQERKVGDGTQNTSDAFAYVSKVLKDTTLFVKLLPFINTFFVLV
jgi:hypothetical protein